MCVQFQIVFVRLSEVSDPDSVSASSGSIDCIMTSQLLIILTLTLLYVRCLPVEEEYQYDDPTEEVSILLVYIWRRSLYFVANLFFAHSIDCDVVILNINLQAYLFS